MKITGQQCARQPDKARQPGKGQAWSPYNLPPPCTGCLGNLPTPHFLLMQLGTLFWPLIYQARRLQAKQMDDTANAFRTLRCAVRPLPRSSRAGEPGQRPIRLRGCMDVLLPAAHLQHPWEESPRLDCTTNPLPWQGCPAAFHASSHWVSLSNSTPF